MIRYFFFHFGTPYCTGTDFFGWVRIGAFHGVRFDGLIRWDTTINYQLRIGNVAICVRKRSNLPNTPA